MFGHEQKDYEEEMIMIFISLIILGLTALYIYYFILNGHCRHIIKKINILNGPKSLPFIGSGYYFLRRNSEGNNKEINIYSETYYHQNCNNLK